MRRHSLFIHFAITLISALTLACGGGEVTSPQAILGPSASAKAQALCEHLTQENGAPCAPVAVGETQDLAGFQVRVERSEPWTGVSTLPQVKNGVERNTVKRVDGSMLGVQWTVTNTTPVKAKAPFGLSLVDGGGNETDGLYFNTRIYGETTGRSSVFADAYGPGQSVEGVTAFPVAQADLEGSLMVLEITERRPDPQDPKGRMKTFVTEQAVLDLGVSPAAI